MKRILLSVLVIGILLLSACGNAVHYTVADALTGKPGDFVNFEVVRIDPSYGGVAYSSDADQYAFAVYDIARDVIMVVVKNKDIDFEPKESAFIKIGEGKLVDAKGMSGSWPVYVIAGKVERANAPENWRED